MEQVQPTRKIAKPLGLYIIAVFDFIAVGLIPFLLNFLAVRSSEAESPFWAVLLALAIPAFVMAASVWVSTGDSIARTVLLVLVTLLSVLTIIHNVVLLSSGEARPIRSIGYILRASFWLAINWWYFNRAHVVAYFKQNQ